MEDTRSTFFHQILEENNNLLEKEHIVDEDGWWP